MTFTVVSVITAAGLPLWVSVAIVGGLCTLYTAVVSILFLGKATLKFKSRDTRSLPIRTGCTLVVKGISIISL